MFIEISSNLSLFIIDDICFLIFELFIYLHGYIKNQPHYFTEALILLVLQTTFYFFLLSII